MLRAHGRSRITTPSPVSGVGVPSIYAFANGAARTWCGTPPPRTLTGVICAEVELSAFPTRTSSSSMRVHTVKGSRYDLRSSTPRSDCCRQSVAPRRWSFWRGRNFLPLGADGIELLVDDGVGFDCVEVVDLGPGEAHGNLAAAGVVVGVADEDVEREVSVVEESFAMSWRSPSMRVAFGRTPPTDVPWSKARSSSMDRCMPASTPAAESRSSRCVGVD